MTWRQVRKALQELTDDRLDDDATVFDSEQDEFHPVKRGWIVDEEGQSVLDEGHFVIVI